MAIKSNFVNPVAAAVGVAFVSSLAASTTAVADDNPFSTAELDAGYQLAGEKGKEGKCGEGPGLTRYPLQPSWYNRHAGLDPVSITTVMPGLTRYPFLVW